MRQPQQVLIGLLLAVATCGQQSCGQERDAATQQLQPQARPSQPLPSQSLQPNSDQQTQAIVAAVQSVVPAVDAPATWPAGRVVREQLPDTRAIDYDFSDVDVEDIEGWLGWIGVDLPIEVSGQLSGWVWGQRGEDGWFNFRNYRVEGAITSPALTLDTWRVNNASIRFGYQAGIWYIGSLRGSVLAPAGSNPLDNTPLGDVRIAARLPLDDGARLEVVGNIDAVEVGSILNAVGVEVQASGGGTLSLRASVPWQSADQLDRWTALSELQLADVEIEQLPTANLDATAVLQSGKWQLSSGELRWLPEPIQINGSGRVDGEFPFQVAVRGNRVPLDQLLVDFDQPELASEVTGTVTLIADVAGDANNGLNRLAAQLTSAAMEFSGQRLSQFDLQAEYVDDELIVTLAPAQIAGGSIAGEASWSTWDKIATGFPSFVDLQLQAFDLAAVSRRLVPEPMSGIATGDIRWASSNDPSNTNVADGADAELKAAAYNWRSSGEVAVQQFQGFDNRFEDLNVSWSKRSEDTDLAVRLQSDDQLQGELFVELQRDVASPLQASQFAGYRASGTLDRFSFQVPNRIANHGPIAMTATGSFTAAGTAEQALQRGRFELSEVDVQLSDTPLRLQTALLVVDPSEYRLERFQMLDPTGRIAGAIVFRRVPTGDHQLNLRLVDFQLEQYTALFGLSGVASERDASFAQSSPLAGIVDAELRISRDATTTGWTNGWEGSISAGLEQFRVRNVEVGDLTLNTQLAEGRADARLAGTILNGPALASTDVPITQVARWFGIQPADQPDVALVPRLVSLQTPNATATQPPPRQADDAAQPNPPQLDPLRLNIEWQGFSLPQLIRLLPPEALGGISSNFIDESALNTLAGEADVVGTIEIPVAEQMDWTAIDFTGWLVDLQASLRNFSIQSLSLGSLEFDLQLQDQWLDTEAQGALLDGPFLAAIQTSLAGTTQADGVAQDVAPERQASFQLDWQGGQLQRLADFVAATPWSPAVAQLLAQYDLSTLSGSVTVDADFQQQGDPQSPFSGWFGELTANTQELVYRQVLIGSVQVQGELQEQLLDATISGELLGGQINLKTEIPGNVWEALTAGSEAIDAAIEDNAATDNNAEDEDDVKVGAATNQNQPTSIKLSGEWNGADLRRVYALATNPLQAQSLTGRLSVSGQSDWDAQTGWVAEANVQIPLLIQGRRPLARQLSSRIVYRDDLLQLIDLSGSVAGGTIRASGTVPLSLLAVEREQILGPRQRIRFDAQRLDVNQLVQLFYPAYADEFSGIVSYRGIADIDRSILISGDAHATEAIAFGLPVQRGNSGLRIRLNRDGSLDELSTSNLTGTAIGGDFGGDLRLRGGSRISLTAYARVGNGQLEQLSRALGFEHILGTGKFDAVLDLSSRQATELGELNGGLQLDFEGGDARSLPFLTEIGRYLPVLTLTSTDILGGRLRARIGQGQLRISDFVVLGDAFWIAGEGSAGLTSGRLDIDAVIETGSQGLALRVTQGASRQLVNSLLPQLMIVTELNQLLTNRSLYLHIAGTTNSPVVQARVAPTLARAVLRNVQQRFLIAPTAAIINESN